MGNYRFRLSDMIPNAWFYKLKDMGKSRSQQNIIYQSSKKKHHHNTSSSSSSSAAATLSSKERQQPHLSHQRKSYYFSRDLTAAPSHDEHENEIFYDNDATKLRISDNHCSEPPRKSSKKRRSTRRNRVSNRASPRLVTSSVPAGCSCRETVESVWTKPDSTPEAYPHSPPDSSSENVQVFTEFGSDPCVAPETFDGMLSLSASCRCRIEKDIVMDIENKPLNAKFQEPADKDDGFDTVSELNLPPIITNPTKSSTKTMETLPSEPTKIRRSWAKFEERNTYGSLSAKVVKEDIIKSSPKKEQKTMTPARRSSANSQGLKLRTNSPRIVNKKIQGRKSISSSSSASSRRSVSDSLAVVKSSKDPQRDFRDSMVEMIIENNICASKDLEDLLACYLSLNSDEYHDLIIRVFKEIWFDIVDDHPK